MPRIIPNLWFDGQAEQAADVYCQLFPNSRVLRVTPYPEGSVHGEPGTAMTVDFELDGQPFTAINGGPQFPFTEAVSLMIECADQSEVDHYWDGLIAGGGEPSMCGWLKDRWGLSWQVVPTGMEEALNDPDRGRVAMEAMLKMQKIDVAVLRAAAGLDP